MYTVISDNRPLPMDHTFSIAIINRSDEPLVSPLVDELNHFNPQEILVFNSRLLVKKGWAPLRQIWTEEKISPGELVNIAIQEANSNYVLVLWSDMRFVTTDLSSHLFIRLEEKGYLCTTPQLYGGHEDSLSKLPSITLPIFNGDGFSIERLMGGGVEQKVFTPIDYAGFYNRSRFLNLGGFDATIKTPYWQKADFAMRASMWGEYIFLNPLLNIYYSQDNAPIDDESIDLSCRIFALKCLAPEMRSKSIVLPFYHLRSLWGLTHAFTLFKEIRSWLHENRFRFRYDAEQVIDQWFQ